MNRHVSPQDLDTEDAAAAYAAPPPPDFRRAQRHSARVRWIRRLLPLSILAAVLVIGGLSLLSQLKVKLDLPFDIGQMTLSGSRLTMELPKLSGFTDDNRGYSVNAKTASQDLTRPDMIDLTDIEARLEMADKGWASVQAKSGSLNTKTQFITLDDGVELAMRGGYGGHLENAEVDVKAGTITTKRPVTFTYLDGRLVADSLSVTERGETARFEGHVQLDFRISQLPRGNPLGAAKAKSQAPAAPAAPAAHGADAAVPTGSIPASGAAGAFAPSPSSAVPQP